VPVVPLVLAVASHAHPTVRNAVPALAEACGWMAGTIGIVTGWPQAWRLWVGRRHEGLSLTANVLGVLYATAWLLYGVATHSFVQTATNILGVAVLGLILVGHLRLTRTSVRRWLPLLLVGLVVLGSVFMIGARPLGLTASAATITGVAPQVILLARSRRAGKASAAGVSRPRWMMSCTANLLWVGYGLLVHDPVIVFNSLVIAAFGAAIVVLATQRRPGGPVGLSFEPEYAIAA
jgi:uncharacterized protein with PQ loop repeat